MNKNFNSLDISWQTILKIVISFIFIYFLYLIQDILVWLIFALIISIVFDPAINFFQKKHLPRPAAAAIVYILFLSLFSFIIYYSIALFAPELSSIYQNLPNYLERASPIIKQLNFKAISLTDLINQEEIKGFLNLAGKNILNILFAFFGGVTSTLFIISIAFFLSLEEHGIEKILRLIAAKKDEAKFLHFWEKSQHQVNAWFLTRILGVLFIAIGTYISFSLFNIEYKFSLAVIAGISDFIPFIGPIFASIIIILIVAITSFEIEKVIFALVAFLLIQQIENNLFLPFLTQKITGIPPVLILISLAIGAHLWGLLGALLILPLAGILYEFTIEYFKERKNNNYNQDYENY